MDTSPQIPVRHETIASTLSRLSAQWGWFIALGVLLIILGLTASIHILTATLVSVLYVGMLMLAGGIFQLIQAWRLKRWSGFLFWSIAGLLYAGAGVLAIINPLAAASALTLLLGAALIACGALRLWIWLQHRSQRQWQWLALSGGITLLAGLLVAAAWPGNSLWLLGLLLAFDLLFQGWTLLLLGVALRRMRTR